MSRYGRTMADAYKEVTKYSEEPEVVEAETVAETEPEEVSVILQRSFLPGQTYLQRRVPYGS